METGFFEKTKRGRGRAKHTILDAYLKAWFPILGQSWYGTEPLVYVDGFAGPGKYTSEDGSVEPGSPIVAYNAAADHTLLTNFRSIVVLIFVEKDPVHANTLRVNLANLASTKPSWVQEKVRYFVLCGEFAVKLEEILESVYFKPSPMFVFADPFGYKGIPNILLRKLLDRNVPGQYGRVPTELFVTVMDGFARRFISEVPQGGPISELMGPEDNWQHLTLRDAFTPEQRREEFMNLYIKNLTSGLTDASSLKFGMREKAKNRYVYHLVFITTHTLGIRKMKAAMYSKSDSAFERVFSEFRENKYGPAPPKDVSEVSDYVAEQIKVKFAGSVANGLTIENWICDETVFHLNFKVLLKKTLKVYQLNPGVNKFVDIIYQFPQQVGQGGPGAGASSYQV